MLSCMQIDTLLSLYVNNKLNKTLARFVELHLENCPKCMAKYETLKKALNDLTLVQDNIIDLNIDLSDTNAENEVLLRKRTKSLVQYLSPYLDSELSDEEGLKVKKYIVSNLEAREILEKMYKLKKALHSCFENSKSKIKIDYSKFIIRQLNIADEVSKYNGIPMSVSIFIMLFVICIVGVVFAF